MNWVPTVALAAAMLLIVGAAVGAAAEIFNVSVALLLVPLAFVADTVTLEAPADVGVPETTPVAALADSPSGKPMTR